jgi:hypothetical protein
VRPRRRAVAARLRASTAIRVIARDGVVTLTGRVPSEARKREAGAITDQVEGVDRVQNQLSVAANDAAETTRVDRVPPANRPAPPPAPNAPPPNAAPRVPPGAEPAPRPDVP